MELKVFKDTIASYGGRWETRLELPVETEILIPDYLPAVFKIVKCLITPVAEGGTASQAHPAYGRQRKCQELKFFRYFQQYRELP